jgi:hypothetical protein
MCSLRKSLMLREVGLVIGGEIAKRDVTFEEPGKLSGAPDPVTVAKDEDLQQQPWIVGGMVPAVLAVGLVKWIEPALGAPLLLFLPAINRFLSGVYMKQAS